MYPETEDFVSDGSTPPTPIQSDFEISHFPNSSSIVENETHNVDGSSSIYPSTDSIEISGLAKNFPVPSNQAIDTEPSLRRINRIRKHIEPCSVWQPKSHALHILDNSQLPQNYKEAISGPQSRYCKFAIVEELNTLREKGVFRPDTHVPHDKKLMRFP